MAVTEYTSGSEDESGFNIEIVFEGDLWTDENQQAFIDAAEYLSTVIIGDVTDFRGNLGDGIVEIDDIQITAEISEIDGVGGTLGSAGPTYIRTDTSLPISGSMEFDTDDVDDLIADDDWYDVVLHEMIHVLGFGTLWETLDLITNYGTDDDPDYRYTGENALYEYETEFADIYSEDEDSDLGVPVENDGGDGTAGGHWDDDTFDNEIMTGYLNTDSDNYVSNMTIAALEDLGYETTYTASEVTTTVCFCRGSLIFTPEGMIRVEDLTEGDMVWTKDRGIQPVRWVGSKRFTQNELQNNSHLRPIRIQPGALGDMIPIMELTVSPQHRMLVDSEIAQRIFKTKEVLVPAVKLVELDGVEIANDHSDVEYYHILFDQHEVILANGAWSEALYTGKHAMESLSEEARQEILTIFPEICEPDFCPLPARMIPDRGKEIKALIARHAKNHKPLQLHTESEFLQIFTN